MPSAACDLGRLELHQLVDVDMPRAGDVTLPRVARLAARSVVLLRRAHVDDRDAAEPAGELLDRDLRHRARTTATSAATDGRRSSSASHAAMRAGSSTPSMSRARITHGT